MFGKKKNEPNPKLIAIREDILDHMMQCDPQSEMYHHLITDLERVDQLLAAQKQSWRPSPDVLFAGLINFAIAAFIAMWETKHIWGSKAAEWMRKPK
jgi:hypothetical protein